MARYPGGLLGRLDNLLHHPRMAWVPRPLTSWVCDVMDHRMGMSWAEIRRARHGKLPGYTNQLDWQPRPAFNNNSSSSTADAVLVHWKSGERLEDG